jgi:hypothetical protein
LRDLQYCGWQTLTSSLRRLERYQHRQFLTSTFANLMGDDYREFERDLDTIPSHLRTIMLANVLCNLLDDRAPELISQLVLAMSRACDAVLAE